MQIDGYSMFRSPQGRISKEQIQRETMVNDEYMTTGGIGNGSVINETNKQNLINPMNQINRNDLISQINQHNLMNETKSPAKYPIIAS